MSLDTLTSSEIPKRLKAVGIGDGNFMPSPVDIVRGIQNHTEQHRSDGKAKITLTSTKASGYTATITLRECTIVCAGGHIVIALAKAALHIMPIVSTSK